MTSREFCLKQERERVERGRAARLRVYDDLEAV
jgi:hypothetical protein